MADGLRLYPTELLRMMKWLTLNIATPGLVLREKTKRNTLQLQHFQKHWKGEYLTSLRETHRVHLEQMFKELEWET